MSKLNNKFGDCCNCPALINDDRLFNNYTSSRLYNDILRRSLKLSDSHDYRDNLQKNGIDIMKTKVYNVEKIRCKNDKNNDFYYDFSKYTFDKPLENQYNGPKCANNFDKFYNVLNDVKDCDKFKFEKSKMSKF